MLSIFFHGHWLPTDYRILDGRSSLALIKIHQVCRCGCVLSKSDRNNHFSAKLLLFVGFYLFTYFLCIPDSADWVAGVNKTTRNDMMSPLCHIGVELSSKLLPNNLTITVQHVSYCYITQVPRIWMSDWTHFNNFGHLLHCLCDFKSIK